LRELCELRHQGRKKCACADRETAGEDNIVSSPNSSGRPVAFAELDEDVAGRAELSCGLLNQVTQPAAEVRI
jgi:hypothetical protein